MGIFAALPRSQREEFKRSVKRQVESLESLIVPGLSGATVQALREKVLALEGKLRPEDDHRNPRHYRRRPEHTESWPCYLWSADAWNTACWAARKRAAGGCELCGLDRATTPRLWNLPPNTEIRKEHVECVCAECADLTPRQTYF